MQSPTQPIPVREVVVIAPGQRERHYWLDMWRYRELFFVLAQRDLAVRYKQTVIGILWAIIRPLLTMVVFTVVFGKIAGLPSEPGTPYALLVFTGLVPWTFFATAFAEASNSLVTNANLISKVYFPRLLVPAATVAVAFVDFLISFAFLALLALWFRFVPSWQIITLPLFIALAFAASLGPALWSTALNVKYRDFRYLVPFIVQFGVYVSPVGFKSSVFPEQWRLLYALNPMVGVIDGFRWAILGGETPLYLPGLAVSAGMAVLFLWIGLRQFRRTETRFADLV